MQPKFEIEYEFEPKLILKPNHEIKCNLMIILHLKLEYNHYGKFGLPYKIKFNPKCESEFLIQIELILYYEIKFS